MMSSCSGTSVLAEDLSSMNAKNVQEQKGGEKLVSEWEELESLSKDELIIELVALRWKFRNLSKVIAELSQTMGSDCLFAEGQIPSDEWLKKISDYAYSKGDNHLDDYGVCSDLSDRYYSERIMDTDLDRSDELRSLLDDKEDD